MTTITSLFGPGYRSVSVGNIVHLATEAPLKLACGREIRDFPLAYQTYGTLNAERSNAILICHALTGDQYVASTHPVTGKSGWWERLVGEGKPIDTNKYFVICSNMIGSCMGSFGPKDINPETREAYGLNFPIVTVPDMVAAQALLLDHLGIDKLFAAIGGSMGGMQVLEWTRQFPKRVFAAIPIATATRQSAQNIAFHEIGRQAIMADPDWCGGDYASEQRYPHKGLAVARMAAHVTYLSEDALQEKFGRNLQDRDQFTYGFEADFQIESYLRHQGMTFVERFDANSYLYLTRAASYFDLTDGGRVPIAKTFLNSPTRFCLISFTSDWLYPTIESQKLARSLNAAGVNVSFTEIETNKGHDAFLFDEPGMEATIRGFLEGSARARGLVL
jgi:homoserine O-acetyltransferase